jgi:hypothetical protein
MPYFPNNAVALRCIGQALQNHNIELFELKTHGNEFRVQCADPNPPYSAVMELRFSVNSIKILEREQAWRRQTNSGFRFDSLPEILRVVGHYIDNKRGQLRRLNNCCFSDQAAVEIEYQTRAGDVRSETLGVNFLRETGVEMYKKRARLNRITMITR